MLPEPVYAIRWPDSMLVVLFGVHSVSVLRTITVRVTRQ